MFLPFHDVGDDYDCSIVSQLKTGNVLLMYVLCNVAIQSVTSVA